MTDDMEYRKELHRRLRRVGIVSSVFSRRGGILRTTALGLSRKEHDMPHNAEPKRGKQELPPPDGAESEGSSEILRAWIVDGELGVSMRSDVVPHPAQWGGILADVAQYVIALFDEEKDATKGQKILDEVLRGFDQRLANPEQTHIDVNGGDANTR